MAKEFLSQRGVPYIEKDVSRDRRAASELQQLGQRGVPVIMVDGHMVVGFDRPQLEHLLAQANAATGAERPRLGASIADAAQRVHYAILMEGRSYACEGPSFCRPQRLSQRFRCISHSARPASGWPSPHTTRRLSALTVHD